MYPAWIDTSALCIHLLAAQAYQVYGQAIFDSLGEYKQFFRAGGQQGKFQFGSACSMHALPLPQQPWSKLAAVCC